MGGVRFPKEKTTRHPEYLDFVRTLPCCICDRPGPNEAHHAGADRGMGIKCNDTRAISLCSRCHAEWHSIGVKSFQEKHNVSVKDMVIVTLEAYIMERL